MAELNNNNATTTVTNVTESINQTNNGGNTMTRKDELAEIISNLEGIDDQTADEIINDIEDAANATILNQPIIDEMELNKIEDPFVRIHAKLTAKHVTTNDMFIKIKGQRYRFVSYGDSGVTIEKVITAVTNAYAVDKKASEKLIIDFYIIWVDLYKNSKDELTGKGLTYEMISEKRREVYGDIEEWAMPNWAKKTTTELNKLQYTADLASNVVYQATNVVASLGVRIPEALVKNTGKAIMHTVNAVDGIVNDWQKRAEIKKLQQERDALDAKINELSGETDNKTPKF